MGLTRKSSDGLLFKNILETNWKQQLQLTEVVSSTIQGVVLMELSSADPLVSVVTSRLCST